jgi:cytochrome c oxidase subunit 2
MNSMAVKRLLCIPALFWALSAQAKDVEVRMTARKYEFEPASIRVAKGDRVTLIITAVDKEHGFKLAAFHIDQKLPKDEPETVEFTADQVGTFPFECSHFCGLGHKKMKGELIVE